MTFARMFVLAASVLALSPVYADTGTTNKASKAEVERKASPSAPKTDEAALFKSLDIDGDGLVSKAEAAGNAEVTQAFDRADRNRDGKLSVAEYERYGKAQAKAKAKTKQAAARKSERSASAGGTSPKAGEK